MKNVLLTGASRGIGNTILYLILDQTQYNIYLIGRNEPALTVEQLNRVKFYHADLRDPSVVCTVINIVQCDSGGIDILINNAGIGIFKLIEEYELDDYHSILSVNLTTPFILIKNCLPHMKKMGYGHIINISSDADHIAFDKASLYCATKHALRGLGDAINHELVGTNVKLTTISPGRVDTYFNNKTPGDRPMSLSPMDVAKQVMYVLDQSEICVIENIRLKSNLE